MESRKFLPRVRKIPFSTIHIFWLRTESTTDCWIDKRVLFHWASWSQLQLQLFVKITTSLYDLLTWRTLDSQTQMQMADGGAIIGKVQFQVIKSNTYRVGINVITNGLSCLNNLIPLKDQNVFLSSFKIKCNISLLFHLKYLLMLSKFML